VQHQELIRSSAPEKEAQIRNVAAFQAQHAAESSAAIAGLQKVARTRGNVFAELMHTVKSNSLGQISAALYEVGGEYRRNM
jgi:methylmalonyl-CoA mutase